MFQEEIVLASGSPRRAELLTLIGIPFRVQKSGVEEIVTETEPGRIVEELSRLKAEDVAKTCLAGALVLGSDTIVWQDGGVLGKPKDKEDAARMLRGLSGRTHEVYTGVTLIRTGDQGARKTRSFHTRSVVHVHAMDEAEIAAYIDTGEPMDKAGAYGIQGAFAAFIDRIEGDTPSVMGLPVARVYQELKTM